MIGFLDVEERNLYRVIKTGRNRLKTLRIQIENFINNVDIGLLMETYDTIVTTSKQFKPLIKEAAPFFSKIIEKI